MATGRLSRTFNLHLIFTIHPHAISTLKKGPEVMSVIGRLDEQVNEVIIKPVGERRRPQDEESQAPAEETERDAQAQAEEREKDDGSTKREETELPVWLL
jgi:hypothetical protein